jgi:hypothetical protein
MPENSERPYCARAGPALHFSIDSNPELPHDGRRPAKRRYLLESNAKEYPAGLIADDGRAQVTAPESKHIGPIDPDASTLKQFLKSVARRATADVSRGRLRGQVNPCVLRRPQSTGRAESAGSRWPGGATKTSRWISNRRIRQILMPKLNAREGSCLF